MLATRTTRSDIYHATPVPSAGRRSLPVGGAVCRSHLDFRDGDRVALELAGYLDRVARVGSEILVVLIRDRQDLAVDDQHVLGAAADTRLRTLAIGHHAVALRRFFVLGATGTVADLAGPGLLGRAGNGGDQQQGGDGRRE